VFSGHDATCTALVCPQHTVSYLFLCISFLLLAFSLIFYLLVLAFCGLEETTEVTMNVVDEDGAEQP